MKKTLLFCLAILMVAFLLVACATTQKGTPESGRGQLTKDPSGRFTFQVSNALVPQPTDGGYFHYRLSSPPMDAYVVAEEAPSEEEAVAQAMRRIGVDPNTLSLGGSASYGEWILKKFTNTESDLWTAIAYQYHNGTIYALLLTGGDDASPDSLPIPIMRLLGSFTFTEAAGEIYRPADQTELEEFVNTTAASYGGSISIAAIKNGEVIYRYATGNRDIATPTSTKVAYHWGSVTKLVTATAVMQLVELGLVDLDSPIDRYFPEYSLGGEITVRNLLTHSSGLPSRGVLHIVGTDDQTLPPLEVVLADYWTSADHLTFTPGSGSAYNNWNFLILGVLVERVSGSPLTAYVEDHIFAPLGIRRTAYSYRDLPPEVPEATSIIKKSAVPRLLSMLNKHGVDGERMIVAQSEDYAYLTQFDILPAWGGIRSTPEDATRFAWMILNGGTAFGNQVLRKNTVKEMLRMQKSTTGTPLGMGLGWFLGEKDDEPIVEHSGGGPGIDSIMRLYPKRGLAVVVMGNVNEYQPGRILEYTAELFSSRD